MWKIFYILILAINFWITNKSTYHLPKIKSFKQFSLLEISFFENIVDYIFFLYFSKVISCSALFSSYQLRTRAKSLLRLSFMRNASLRVKGDTFSSVCLMEILMFAQVISVTVRVIGFDWLWCRVFSPVLELSSLGNASSVRHPRYL